MQSGENGHRQEADVSRNEDTARQLWNGISGEDGEH